MNLYEFFGVLCFELRVFFFIFHVFNIFESFNIENGLRVTPRIQKHSGMFIDASCPTFTFMNLYDWNTDGYKRFYNDSLWTFWCSIYRFRLHSWERVYNGLIKGLYKVCFVHHYILDIRIQWIHLNLAWVVQIQHCVKGLHKVWMA